MASDVPDSASSLHSNITGGILGDLQMYSEEFCFLF